MGKLGKIVFGGLISTQTATATTASETITSLNTLKDIGINSQIVQKTFLDQANIYLNWDEVLKVSTDDEGKEIAFDTLDGISITVPLSIARGPFNKGDSVKD